MASQGDGRRQPQLCSFGRQPDGDARRWAAGSLFRPSMGHFNETERLLRLVLLEPSPLLALEEKQPGAGSKGRTEPLSLPGRSRHQLALDVEGFSAEELSVQLEGRKLTVLGKQEKEEAAAEEGCACWESRQVRKELLLPLDADLEALTCALGHDGHLRIQAPRLERPIPVPVQRRSPSEAGETDGGAEEAEKPDGADEQ